MKQSIAETFHGGSSNEFIVSRRGASNSSKSTIPLMHSEEAMTAHGTYPFKDGAAVNAALGVFARTGKKELQSETASLRA
jgi:hypothetical protein